MADPTSPSATARPARLLVYAATIFLSAFLLFLVQPILAKVILPWFGGAASVWATAMLFFQGVLLLGYLYAHWSVRRLGPRLAVLLHLGLLAVSLLLLPVAPQPSWKPSGAEDPIFRILGLLGVCAGLPYFLLSTTGPLMQAWYARSEQVAFPYRLFALSNLGSLLALLAYPVSIEPLVRTRLQLSAWSWAYAAFCLLCGASAALYWVRGRAPEQAPDWSGEGSRARPGWGTALLWIALPACASTLLLAITNHICQNVAAIPLLWVVPLGLYLLSFILCFDREGWYRPAWFRWLLPVTLAGLAFCLFREDTGLPPRVLISLFAAALFLCCLFCHGELAALKPHARHLTSYYLMIALGGALGGLFVGLAAPRLLASQFELQIGLAACCILALLRLYGYTSPRYLTLIGVTLLLVFFFAVQLRVWVGGIRLMARNFYGAMWVDETEGGAVRRLHHGRILHGAQFTAPARSRQSTTYYGPKSGGGLALERRAGSNRRLGVIGLGVGTLACYGRAGDTLRFYEINPLVIELARSEFHYLKESAARIEVELGDARLVLEREPSQQFDVFVIDAFSGDSIPAHLLTREAFSLYFRHLKRDGLLAAHISSKYVDLAPLLRKLAAAFGQQAMVVETASDPPRQLTRSTWVLMGATLGGFGDVGGIVTPQESSQAGPQLWTDDYTHLLAVLR